jgi:hypothetical protein
VPEIVIPVKLEDLISFPARKAAEAMSGAVKQATALERAIKSLETQQQRAAALGNKTKAAALGGQAEKIETALKSIRGEAGLAEFAGAALEGAAGGVAVLGGALYEGAKAAIEASGEFNRLSASFEALGASAGVTGPEVLAMVTDVSKAVPESEAQLRSWTQALMAAGMTDLGKVKDSLIAAAGAETLVAGGGDKVLSIYQRLQEAAVTGTKIKFSTRMLTGTGVTEKEFMDALGMTPQNFQAAIKGGTIVGTQISDAMTKVLKEKTKGSLAESMKDMGSIVQKGTDSIKRLFEGINIEPFTTSVKDFFDVFDQGKSSGAALHDILVEVFGAVFQGASTGTQAITRMFLYAELYSLKLINTFGEMKNSIGEVPWKAIAAGVATVFAPAIISGIVGFGTAMVGAATALGTFSLAAAPLVAAGGAMFLLVDQITKLHNELKGFTLHDALNPFRGGPAGDQMVKGNDGQMHSLGETPAGMSGGAIASYRQHGGHALGGEVNAPAPGEAFASVKPGEHIVPAGKTLSGSDGGANVDVGGVHVHVYGTPGAPAAQQARDIGNEVAEQLAILFQQLRLTQGV